MFVLCRRVESRRDNIQDTFGTVRWTWFGNPKGVNKRSGLPFYSVASGPGIRKDMLKEQMQESDIEAGIRLGATHSSGAEL